MVITHALEWPTLTMQWMPDKEVFAEKGFTRHRLLLGTHTSGQDNNYLQIATVNLPNTDNSTLDVKDYDEEKGGMYGVPFARSHMIEIGSYSSASVSYTHLTLPTKRIV